LRPGDRPCRSAVAGDGAGFEVADFVEFFEAHNGEGRATEDVFDEEFFVGERGNAEIKGNSGLKKIFVCL
jgi:hypothetical protein